jgi:polyisoprenoid-binding protein YceI
MKRIFLFLALALVSYTGVHAQVYMTRTGFAGFYSKTSLEDVQAENNQVYAAIDAGKKSLAFTILLKSFIFPKALMQEHFNENYVESDKYPTAVFTGTYTGDVPLDKDGVYNIAVKGSLTLHHVTKNIETPATIEVKGGTLSGKAQFKLQPENFDITIPSVVRDKIEKEMLVTVKINCNPVK